MTNAVLAALKDAARRKDGAGIDALLGDVEGEAELDSFDLLVTGIEVKESGRPGAAERLFSILLSRDWTYPAAHYEMAVVLRYAGRHQDAIHHAKHAVRYAPHEFRSRQLFAHLLHAVGAHPEAEAQAAELNPSTPEEHRAIGVLRDFGAYLQEHPRGRALQLVQQVRDTYYWMNTEEVANQINAAMDEKRGFSLIRMGDGEGAFTKVSEADEAKYARLYGWMRRDWASALFGEAFDPEATGYASVVNTLREVSLSQDVVGVPYAPWVDHEYAISSIRGVPCVLNVHRSYLASRPASLPFVCDQRIHIELHAQGFVDPILRRAGSVGVISCHSALPERMKAAFGLEEVELFKIPGEKYTEGMRDADQMSGEHFPFVFWDIVRRLSVPHEGRVFMIAAGTLAKFYADVIKRNGGIALDLGSLVDGWLNVSSRPGYGSWMQL